MIRSWWAAEKSNSEPVPGLAEAILVFGIWVPLLGADEKSEVLQGVHRMTMYIRVYIYTYFICNVAGILLCLSSSLLLRLQYNMFMCIVTHHHHHHHHHPSSLIPQSSSLSPRPRPLLRHYRHDDCFPIWLVVGGPMWFVDLRSNLTMTILKSRFMVKQVGIKMVCRRHSSRPREPHCLILQKLDFMGY
jgi:hypothetical protein